ncbi:MAG TPA: hypothetical protein PLT25_03065 [Acidocella sp.]|nr:hypothetical protein [Acidocella sp.]HQU03674.1 hypothetical protein [Acidocella sp.]
MQRTHFTQILLVAALSAAGPWLAKAQTTPPAGHEQAVVQVDLVTKGTSSQLGQANVTPGNPLHLSEKAGTLGLTSDLDITISLDACPPGQISLQLVSRHQDPESQSIQQASDQFCAALPATGTGHSKFNIGNGSAVVISITAGLAS